MKKTRFIPYGYTIRNGRTIVEHSEAEIIRYIFDEYIKGSSLKELAEELTARRISYTEKSDVWDKARIARIISNSRYLGDEEYDPIIDETTFEDAATIKSIRQKNKFEKECEGIALLRNKVMCGKCGKPMVRRLCSKRQIKESWVCTNDECGYKVRISDGDLLMKINILINRIIENSSLLLRKKPTKITDSVAVAKLQREIDVELNGYDPREDVIIQKISDIAKQLYEETQATKTISAQITRKRVALMEPQESFNCDYFSDLISYIKIEDSGRITLHTKVETEITEGDKENGSNQNT